jgi:hypothetical protein
MSSLKADYQDSIGNSRGAAFTRIADKYSDFERLARANKELFPDAEKWVKSLERAEQLSADLASLSEKISSGKGYLSLESAQLQDRITDGVVSEREGRREINALEIQYRDNLRGELLEMLAIARARAGEKADQDATVLQIKQQIEEVNRLGHAIDSARASARGMFESAFADGLDQLNQGLKHAAATFGLELLKSIQQSIDQKLAHQLSQVLFGKNDQFGSDSGLIGKLLKKIGLGGLLGGKDAGGADSATLAQSTNTQATTDNSIETQLNSDFLNTATLATQFNADSVGFNTTATDINTAAVDALTEAMRQSQAASSGGGGLLSGLLGSVLGSLAGSLVSGIGSSGGSISDGLTGTVTSDYGGFHPIGHANGGTFDANAPIWVGERGKELIYPHFAGTVVPNEQIRSAVGGAQKSGGGHTFNINVNVPPVPDARGLDRSARSIAREIRSQLERMNWD